MILVKEKELKKAGIELSEKEFSEKAFSYSLASSAVLVVTVFALSEIFTALIFGALAFIVGILVSVKIPEILRKKKAKKVEKHLPFALMAMAVEMNINLSFEKILENLSKGDYGEFSKQIRKTQKEIEAGATIQKALFDLSERIDSKMLKRSVSQIVSIYEHGSEEKGEPVKQLAKELLARQKIESKEFTGKMTMYSVVFVVLSAVIPAMFQAFVSIGSTFMELDFTATQILLISTVLFPALNLGILLMIRNKTPEILKG
ncbi:MAG: type II secretion system F family protein [Candidatus Micrarchaeota archaeon]